MALLDPPFRALVEKGVDGLLLLDAQGEVLYANPALAGLLGVETGELMGRAAAGLVHPDDVAAARAAFAACLDRPAHVERVALRLRHATGHWIHADVATRDARADPDLRAVLVSCRDVSTWRRHLDAEAQSQRLEAVARVAGGIAHDFNNLLGITLGYSDLILRRMAEEDPLRAKVQEIRKAAERAGGLTQQLMVFSRSRSALASTIDITALVEGMADMLRRTLGPDVDLVLQLDPAASRVRADRTQLGQVLTHLASNARDAMPHGGRLVVDCRDCGSGAAEGQVRLAFTDTGTGMEPAVLQRLFEPFFTTKPRQQGRGLGLATVYRIATQAGARIEIDSVVGQGTTVGIYWPAVPAAPAVVREPEPTSQGRRL